MKLIRMFYVAERYVKNQGKPKKELRQLALF